MKIFTKFNHHHGIIKDFRICGNSKEYITEAFYFIFLIKITVHWLCTRVYMEKLHTKFGNQKITMDLKKYGFFFVKLSTPLVPTPNFHIDRPIERTFMPN